MLCLFHLFAPVVYSGCASDPCQNEGTCFQANDFYICQCAPGYRGFNCEEGMEKLIFI